MYNIKPKEGKISKFGEFNASKEWFDNLGKRFGLKNVKRTGDFVDQEAEDEFPGTMKKIIEKGYWPEQVVNAEENA